MSLYPCLSVVGGIIKYCVSDINRHFSRRKTFILDFYRASSYASAVLAVVILSVSPSVCHTRALWQNQTMHCGYFDTTLYFSDTNSGWWAMPPSVSNLRSKWPSPFETRRLWQISAYNVSAVRDSEKNWIMTNRKSTTGFPTSYRWVHTLPLSTPKDGSKAIFVFLFKFWISNVTDRHWGPKRKLRVGYTERRDYNAHHIFIIQCGIARFLYAMCVFEV